MAEILIKAVDATNSNPDKDRQACYKRGDPVVVFESGHEWGRGEGLPTFVVLELTDATADEVRQYLEPWVRKIDYAVVNQNLALDGFRLRVATTNFNNSSGEGKITRAKAENFLNKWGANVVSAGDNAVTFDVGIFNALKSEGFWGEYVSDLVITEESYTQATGVHRLRIDYSGVPDQGNFNGARRVTGAEREVLRRKGTIVSHETEAQVIVADFTRTDARTAFQNSVREKLEGWLTRRQFNLLATILDAAVLAGGKVSLTKAQFVAALRNHETEDF